MALADGSHRQLSLRGLVLAFGYYTIRYFGTFSSSEPKPSIFASFFFLLPDDGNSVESTPSNVNYPLQTTIHIYKKTPKHPSSIQKTSQTSFFVPFTL